MTSATTGTEAKATAMRTGLSCIAYHFDETRPIECIPQLEADPQLAQAFRKGAHVRFAHTSLTLSQQAVAAARQTLAHPACRGRTLDAVVIGTSELRDWTRYPELVATQVLQGLGLTGLPVLGTTMGGCANLAASLRAARNMLVAERMRNVLVIETNQVRGGMARPQVSPSSGFPGAIFGDGAVSVLVTADEPEFELLAMAQTMLPIDKAEADRHEAVANDLAGYRDVLDRALAAAGVAPDALNGLLMPNVHCESVVGWAQTLGLPVERIFLDNIPRKGHLWSADTLINLHDHCRERPVHPGANFLLLSQAESHYSAIVCRKP